MAGDLRDTQRSKVYKAERAALKKLSAPLPTVQDVELYISKQFKRKTITSRYGHAVDFARYGLNVADGRGTRNALAYGSRTISIPRWARTEWVVLHEMAHIILNRLNETWSVRQGTGSRAKELRGEYASHGWQFASIYYDLVRFIMGREAGEALKESYRAHKVRMRPKKERASVPATPEMIARLAKARETRLANLAAKKAKDVAKAA